MRRLTIAALTVGLTMGTFIGCSGNSEYCEAVKNWSSSPNPSTSGKPFDSLAKKARDIELVAPDDIKAEWSALALHLEEIALESEPGDPAAQRRAGETTKKLFRPLAKVTEYDKNNCAR